MMAVANTPAAWGERAALATPWDASLWSERGQTERFYAVLRYINAQPGDMLLDFGSGPGRLNDFLDPGVEYHAYDWAKPMLERVAREHPAATVHPRLPDMVFDHVVCVGPFNLKDNWWKQRTWDTLAELWSQHVGKTLAVSLYRGADPDCLTYSYMDLSVFARQMGCWRFVVDASYMNNDLLLVMYR